MLRNTHNDASHALTFDVSIWKATPRANAGGDAMGNPRLNASESVRRIVIIVEVAGVEVSQPVMCKSR